MNIIRWILIIPSALIFSQLATSLFMLITFGIADEFYYLIRPFVAEGFGGFGFIYAGVFTSPNKGSWVIWSLLGLYVMLATINVLNGFEFYTDLIESISCTIGAIIGTAVVRENQ